MKTLSVAEVLDVNAVMASAEAASEKLLRALEFDSLGAGADPDRLAVIMAEQREAMHAWLGVLRGDLVAIAAGDVGFDFRILKTAAELGALIAKV